jgi:hypothetical protein
MTAWTLGRKLKAWMAANAEAERPLWNANAVANELSRLGCATDQKTVDGWIKTGRAPRMSKAQALADLMSIDVLYLLDLTRPWPPPVGRAALEDLARSVPRDEQEPIAEMLSDPVVRRMLVAAWKARGAR